MNNMSMTGAPRFTKAWLAWAIASILGFSAIEAKALAAPAREAATLSAHLRLVFGFSEQGPVPPVRRGLFYLLWGWFGLHILQHTAGCVSCINPPIPPS